MQSFFFFCVFFCVVSNQKKKKRKRQTTKKNVKLMFHPFRHAVNASFFFVILLSNDCIYFSALYERDKNARNQDKEREIEGERVRYSLPVILREKKIFPLSQSEFLRRLQEGRQKKEKNITTRYFLYISMPLNINEIYVYISISRCC